MNAVSLQARPTDGIVQIGNRARHDQGHRALRRDAHGALDEQTVQCRITL